MRVCVWVRCGIFYLVGFRYHVRRKSRSSESCCSMSLAAVFECFTVAVRTC